MGWVGSLTQVSMVVIKVDRHVWNEGSRGGGRFNGCVCGVWVVDCGVPPFGPSGFGLGFRVVLGLFACLAV